MGWQGEGRRFTVAMAGRGLGLGVALVAIALVGCAESQADAAASTSISTTSAVVSPAAVAPTAVSPAGPTSSPAGPTAATGTRPERVVQRLSPAGEEQRARNGRVEAERPESAATARGSEASVSDTTITPRHLEAELNRLEAELAN